MRLIDADALQSEYMRYHDGKRIVLVDVAPTIEERKTGKWTLLPNGDAICQECKHIQKSAWDVDGWDNFCHHCGADMRGE